jgi:hypothetical protein
MSLGINILVNGTPDASLTAASRVEVYERMGETTHYCLTYPEAIADGDLPLLVDSRLDPGSVLSIQAESAGTLVCLVAGPVYSQQIRLVHGGDGSSVEVKGADNTLLMDREVKSAIWTDVSDSEVVTSILSTYGFAPDVMDTATRHLEAKHTLVQRETDLRFVRRLARRNGGYFWLDFPEIDLETAHFQRPDLDGEPANTLLINLPNTNIETLDITWNTERPTATEGLQLDLNTKTDIDGGVAQSPQTPLGTLALASIATGVRTAHVAAPANDAGDMQARGEGTLIEADWFIRATCRTSLSRLGRLVRAHTVVLVQGAGSRHSGLYYVASVRHTIDATTHLMDIELIRNGWG